MKITSLKIRNYRTLEAIDLVFPSSYTAICVTCPAFFGPREA